MCIRGFALVIIFSNVHHCLADLSHLPEHMILGNGKFPSLIPNITNSGLLLPKVRNPGGAIKNLWSPKLQVLLGEKRLDSENTSKDLRQGKGRRQTHSNEEGVEKYALPDLRIFQDMHKNSVHKTKEKVGHDGRRRHDPGTGDDGGEVFDSILEVMDAVLRKTQLKMKELLDRELRSREAMGKPPPKKQPVLSIIPLLKRIQRMHRTPTGLPDPSKAIAAIIGVLRDASAAGALTEPRTRGTRGSKDPLGTLNIGSGVKVEDLKIAEKLLQPDSGKCGCEQWNASNVGKKRRGRSEDKPKERTRNEILRSVGARSSELALDAIDQVTSRLYRMMVGFLG